MSKVIRIGTDCGVKLVDLNDGSGVSERLAWMREQIGCDYIETVPTYRFDDSYQMVVDEEGKLNHAAINPIASWLYGPGEVIVGNALLMKLKPDENGEIDLAGMEEEEARMILEIFNQ